VVSWVIKWNKCNSLQKPARSLEYVFYCIAHETTPLCTYAAPALAFTSKQIQELNACWNSVIRRLFGYSKHESVKAVLLGLGRLNVRHLIMQRKAKFYKSLYLSNNSLLYNIFCMRLMLYSGSDTLLQTVFDKTVDTMQVINSMFCAYCDS